MASQDFTQQLHHCGESNSPAIIATIPFARLVLKRALPLASPRTPARASTTTHIYIIPRIESTHALETIQSSHRRHRRSIPCETLNPKSVQIPKAINAVTADSARRTPPTRQHRNELFRSPHALHVLRRLESVPHRACNASQELTR